MTVYTEESIERRQISPLVIIGVAAAILLLLALLLARDGERPLKPIRPSATPVELALNSQPMLVTFDELNANPYAARDQRIRVTGSYTPQPKPDCPNYKGLLIQWALISDSLQLNGRGYEDVLKLVPEGTTLTVEGIWRLYEGTAGCGKDASPKLIWYLQVERIIQPNPLPSLGPTPEGGQPSAPVGTPAPEGTVPTPTTGTGTATLSPTGQLSPTPTATATLTTIPTLTPSATATATLPGGDLTLTPASSTPTPGTGTTPATLTPSSTSPAGTSTPPPGTPGTGVPTVPPLATSTPGSGYPGPGTSTPTIDPYPSN